MWIKVLLRQGYAIFYNAKLPNIENFSDSNLTLAVFFEFEFVPVIENLNNNYLVRFQLISFTPQLFCRYIFFILIGLLFYQ